MKTLLVIAMDLLSTSIAGEERRPQTSHLSSFVPAPGQTFSLDLDTVPGKYSNWRHHDLGSISALRATMRIPTIRRDAKWAPSFSIWVEKADPKQPPDSPDRVGIQFVSLGQKLPLV